MKQQFIHKQLVKSGIRAIFTNYGARLISLELLEEDGVWTDVVLGFPTARAYVLADERYYGAIVGRYANRIAGAGFQQGGRNYSLEMNSPPHTLHGGTAGWHAQYWEVLEHSPEHIRFQWVSAAGEAGFPGKAIAQATYRLAHPGILDIQYEVRTDQICPINLTHHSYFNLAGEGSGDVLGHILTLPATHYTPLDGQMIPTGEYAPVAGTPLDFQAGKAIGRDIASPHPQMERAGGYDHNFVLKEENSSVLVHAATVREPVSGRTMQLHTNQPGLQFYTANGLSGKDVGKSGVPYLPHAGFCLEPQHFPNSPNTPHFPSCWVRPGEVYAYQTRYVFGR